MKTYTLKLKTTSTVDYNLYDGTTLVSDTDLGTLFGSASEAYFVFDFNSLTPTNTTALNILDSNGNAVIANTGLTGIAENKNFKGTWSASATAFDSFVALTGVAMDESQLSTLVGMIKDAGPGKAKVLTSADYNYPTTGTKTCVAIWMLSAGLYDIGSGVQIKTSSSATPTEWHGSLLVSEQYNGNKSVLWMLPESAGYYYVFSGAGDIISSIRLSAGFTTLNLSTGNKNIWSVDYGVYKVLNESSGGQARYLYYKSGNGVAVLSNSECYLYVYKNVGAKYFFIIYTDQSNRTRIGGGSADSSTGAFTSLIVGPVDALDSTSTASPLSANQGRVLKELVDSIAVRASGAPTTATVGSVGTLYEDTTNGKLYQCTAVTSGTDPDPDTYTWTEVGGGSGITELTSADYNYPTDNPNRVALWLLEPGMYNIASGTNVAANNSTSTTSYAGIYIVTKSGDSTRYWGYRVGTGDLVWASIDSAGNGQPHVSPKNVVQTTGTSITDVMSQNAVSSMVYADPGARTRIRIGNNADSGSSAGGVAIGYSARSGENGVAIGYQAVVQGSAASSVALGNRSQVAGSYSVAFPGGDSGSNQGVFQIGVNRDGYETLGYNNSSYRLLSGLYDGQSAHDAATVAQGNRLMTAAPTTTDEGVLGQLWTDTTNMHTYQLTAIDDTTDPSNPVYTWTMRW